MQLHFVVLFEGVSFQTSTEFHIDGILLEMTGEYLLEFDSVETDAPAWPALRLGRIDISAGRTYKGRTTKIYRSPWRVLVGKRYGLR